FASLDYREFPIKDGAVQVPADCAGLYLVKFTPEVQPLQHLSPPDYMVRTVVEVRQPNTRGSATVLTPDNRSHYGRGEEVPFTVAVRGTERGRPTRKRGEADKGVKFSVRLLEGKRPLAQAEGRAKGPEAVPFKLPAALTAGLKPGKYALAV